MDSSEQLFCCASGLGLFVSPTHVGVGAAWLAHRQSHDREHLSDCAISALTEHGAGGLCTHVIPTKVRENAVRVCLVGPTWLRFADITGDPQTLPPGGDASAGGPAGLGAKLSLWPVVPILPAASERAADGAPPAPRQAALSPDGRFLAVCCGSDIAVVAASGQLLPTATAFAVTRLRHGAPVGGLAWEPLPELLPAAAAMDEAGGVCRCGAPSCDRLASEHGRAVRPSLRATVHPVRARLLAWDRTGSATVWLEAGPLEPLSFAQEVAFRAAACGHAGDAVPGAAGDGSAVATGAPLPAPCSAAWVHQRLLHNRLHWAWAPGGQPQSGRALCGLGAAVQLPRPLASAEGPTPAAVGDGTVVWTPPPGFSGNDTPVAVGSAASEGPPLIGCSDGACSCRCAVTLGPTLDAGTSAPGRRVRARLLCCRDVGQAIAVSGAPMDTTTTQHPTSCADATCCERLPTPLPSTDGAVPRTRPASYPCLGAPLAPSRHPAPAAPAAGPAEPPPLRSSAGVGVGPDALAWTPPSEPPPASCPVLLLSGSLVDGRQHLSLWRLPRRSGGTAEEVALGLLQPALLRCGSAPAGDSLRLQAAVQSVVAGNEWAALLGTGGVPLLPSCGLGPSLDASAAPRAVAALARQWADALAVNACLAAGGSAPPLSSQVAAADADGDAVAAAAALAGQPAPLRFYASLADTNHRGETERGVVGVASGSSRCGDAARSGADLRAAVRAAVCSSVAAEVYASWSESAADSLLRGGDALLPCAPQCGGAASLDTAARHIESGTAGAVVVMLGSAGQPGRKPVLFAAQLCPTTSGVQPSGAVGSLAENTSTLWPIPLGSAASSGPRAGTFQPAQELLLEVAQQTPDMGAAINTALRAGDAHCAAAMTAAVRVSLELSHPCPDQPASSGVPAAEPGCEASDLDSMLQSAAESAILLPSLMLPAPSPATANAGAAAVAATGAARRKRGNDLAEMFSSAFGGSEGKGSESLFSFSGGSPGPWAAAPADTAAADEATADSDASCGDEVPIFKAAAPAPAVCSLSADALRCLRLLAACGVTLPAGLQPASASTEGAAEGSAGSTVPLATSLAPGAGEGTHQLPATEPLPGSPSPAASPDRPSLAALVDACGAVCAVQGGGGHKAQSSSGTAAAASTSLMLACGALDPPARQVVASALMAGLVLHSRPVGAEHSAASSEGFGGSNASEAPSRAAAPPVDDRFRVPRLSWLDCACALVSETQEALLQALLQHATQPPCWDLLCALRLPFWLRSVDALRGLVERVAAAEYVQSDRDPFSAALPHMMLGLDRLPVLRGLFRLSVPHARVHTFLQNDFSMERWQRAAARNAFALLGQHRPQAAAAFFLLAGQPQQAIKCMLVQGASLTIAFAIARLCGPQPAIGPDRTQHTQVAVRTAAAVASLREAYVAAASPAPAASFTVPAASLPDARAGAGGEGDATSAVAVRPPAAVQPTRRIAGLAGRAGRGGFGFDDEQDSAMPGARTLSSLLGDERPAAGYIPPRTDIAGPLTAGPHDVSFLGTAREAAPPAEQSPGLSWGAELALLDGIDGPSAGAPSSGSGAAQGPVTPPAPTMQADPVAHLVCTELLVSDHLPLAGALPSTSCGCASFDLDSVRVLSHLLLGEAFAAASHCLRSLAHAPTSTSAGVSSAARGQLVVLLQALLQIAESPCSRGDALRLLVHSAVLGQLQPASVFDDVGAVPGCDARSPTLRLALLQRCGLQHLQHDSDAAACRAVLVARAQLLLHHSTAGESLPHGGLPYYGMPWAPLAALRDAVGPALRLEWSSVPLGQSSLSSSRSLLSLAGLSLAPPPGPTPAVALLESTAAALRARCLPAAAAALSRSCELLACAGADALVQVRTATPDSVAGARALGLAVADHLVAEWNLLAEAAGCADAGALLREAGFEIGASDGSACGGLSGSAHTGRECLLSALVAMGCCVSACALAATTEADASSPGSRLLVIGQEAVTRAFDRATPTGADSAFLSVFRVAAWASCASEPSEATAALQMAAASAAVLASLDTLQRPSGSERTLPKGQRDSSSSVALLQASCDALRLLVLPGAASNGWCSDGGLWPPAPLFRLHVLLAQRHAWSAIGAQPAELPVPALPGAFESQWTCGMLTGCLETLALTSAIEQLKAASPRCTSAAAVPIVLHCQMMLEARQRAALRRVSLGCPSPVAAAGASPSQLEFAAALGSLAPVFTALTGIPGADTLHRNRGPTRRSRAGSAASMGSMAGDDEAEDPSAATCDTTVFSRDNPAGTDGRCIGLSRDRGAAAGLVPAFTSVYGATGRVTRAEGKRATTTRDLGASRLRTSTSTAAAVWWDDQTLWGRVFGAFLPSMSAHEIAADTAAWRAFQASTVFGAGDLDHGSSPSVIATASPTTVSVAAGVLLSSSADLFAGLGGPGLLWLLATERRACVRAIRRGLRQGHLPDVPHSRGSGTGAAPAMQLRPRGGPPIRALCGLTLPAPAVLGSPPAASRRILLLAVEHAGVQHAAAGESQAEALQPRVPRFSTGPVVPPDSCIDPSTLLERRAQLLAALSAGPAAPAGPCNASSAAPLLLWPTDRYEFALPFTLCPGHMAAHPDRAAYLRGGPEGVLAMVSVALEPLRAPGSTSPAANERAVSATAKPAAAGVAAASGIGPRPLQLVHRVEQLYVYDPIPSHAAHHAHAQHTAAAGRQPGPGSGQGKAPHTEHAATSMARVAPESGARQRQALAGTALRIQPPAGSTLGTGAADKDASSRTAHAGHEHADSSSPLVAAARGFSRLVKGLGLPGFGHTAGGSASEPRISAAIGRRDAGLGPISDGLPTAASPAALPPLAASGPRSTLPSASSAPDLYELQHHASVSTGMEGLWIDASAPLDEQITRVRVAPAGNVHACFASGVVRVWNAEREAPVACLATSSSHSFLSPAPGRAREGPGRVASRSAVTGSAALTSSWSAADLENAALQRPVLAATDVCCLSDSGHVFAASACPLFPPAGRDLRSGTTAAQLSSAAIAAPPDHPAQSALQQVVLSAWGLHVFDTRCDTRSAIVGKGAALPGLPGCTCVVHHSDTASLLAGGEDGSLLCFDLRTMRERDRVAGVPTRSAASFSRTAESAASLAHADHVEGESAPARPSYRTSVAWGHAGAVSALAVGGGGQYLVSGGQDGEVRLWSVSELAFARTFPRVHEGRAVTSDTLANLANSWTYLAGVSGLWCAGDDVFSSGYDGAVSRTAVRF